MEEKENFSFLPPTTAKNSHYKLKTFTTTKTTTKSAAAAIEIGRRINLTYINLSLKEGEKNADKYRQD